MNCRQTGVWNEIFPTYLRLQTETPSSRLTTLPPESLHSPDVIDVPGLLGPLDEVGDDVELGEEELDVPEGRLVADAGLAFEAGLAFDAGLAAEAGLADELDACAAESVVNVGAT